MVTLCCSSALLLLPHHTMRWLPHVLIPACLLPPQTTPPVSFSADELPKLTERIQNAGTEVVEAKAGKGSATLSMAYAAARMAESTLLGLAGEPNIYECAFVDSDVSSCFGDRCSAVWFCVPVLYAWLYTLLPSAPYVDPARLHPRMGYSDALLATSSMPHADLPTLLCPCALSYCTLNPPSTHPEPSHPSPLLPAACSRAALLCLQGAAGPRGRGQGNAHRRHEPL
jgi:hypothetical protein